MVRTQNAKAQQYRSDVIWWFFKSSPPIPSLLPQQPEKKKVSWSLIFNISQCMEVTVTF